MAMITLDLEGVLVPEIWIAVAERTGIPELRLTTRDIADYDELMRHRLSQLEQHGLRMSDITAVIAGIEPMPGARHFLGWVREHHQLIILSDTFSQFAGPLMRQLDWPTLFCHDLVVREDRIVDYRLRLPDQKRAAVRALHQLNFQVIAAGDSLNDLAMLDEADAGFFFRPPAGLPERFPQHPVATEYHELRALIEEAVTTLRR